MWGFDKREKNESKEMKREYTTKKKKKNSLSVFLSVDRKFTEPPKKKLSFKQTFLTVFFLAYRIFSTLHISHNLIYTHLYFYYLRKVNNV